MHRVVQQPAHYRLRIFSGIRARFHASSGTVLAVFNLLIHSNIILWKTRLSMFD